MPGSFPIQEGFWPQDRQQFTERRIETAPSPSGQIAFRSSSTSQRRTVASPSENVGRTSGPSRDFNSSPAGMASGPSRSAATFQQNATAGRAPPNHSLNPNPAPSRNPPIVQQRISSKSGPSRAPRSVLIAVFGMTGTGKTSLIKNLAGDSARKLKTGHGLESCTQDIETVEWLECSYHTDTLLSGIIYLHRISDIRMSGSSIKNLRMFRKLCGSENMSKATLVTTMWDKVTPEEGALRERGSLVKRHDGSRESAEALVHDMLDNVPMTIKLQEEIASGKALIDTDAGASINEEILKLQKQHVEELEAVKEEMAWAMKQGNKALQEQLQAEHARMIAEIKKRAQEQEQLHQIRISKLERELSAASLDRKKLEDGLKAQREASRRQEEQASRLERDVKSMSNDRQRLENLVESQNKLLLAAQTAKVAAPTFYGGSKDVVCIPGCGATYTIYGPGANRCPSCRKAFNNDEVSWNAMRWNMT
ncbi:uncharacterized protein PAC_05885 [Phialocephala subalpina]|uniref:G domain-containing protein n=1 Tax=Phialocephala subalpina TaxID=576137 RepID=A0A1L7WTA0_9HELO|nr:uncharacterized protein PAC_05885 [Phialocephala subalpina]